MRKLVVFRGHQGSGKSHTINALGLDEWTLSSDSIRSFIASPMLTSDGTMIVNQDVNHQVFSELFRRADERMGRGETLCIDSTGLNIADFRHWLEMARVHRYKVAYVDMTDIPIELALARQEERHELRKVRRASLERFLRIMQENPLTVTDPDIETIIKGDVEGTHIAKLQAWLEEPVLDLSAYRQVVHIGDLQGCFTVLNEGPLAGGLRDDTFYVFVGDLLDRGIENGKVLRWFRDNAVGRDNVALMWGNHEDHIQRWSRGWEAVSNEFRHRTLPQLEAEGLTPEDGDAVCAMAREFLIYRYGETTVFVNHAGLSVLPRDPWRVSLWQYAHGTGNYSDDVDEQYASHGGRIVQVHGHRNLKSVPIRANALSFNLEDQVEHGGKLRTATLDADGWSEKGYQNWTFRPLGARMALETKITEDRKKARRKYPDWIVKGEPSQLRFSSTLLDAMKEHTGVREKSSLGYPHIASLNFTRDVFYDKSWDDVVVKARGLFYNTDTFEVAARGYDKFFNIGETDETQIEVLADKLVYPVVAYLKENGFLGNLGYDAVSGSRMVASKSTSDGDFATWFREILEDTVSPEKLDRLDRYLRDAEASMTFEVNDPVNDPHIIEYDRRHVVLLDVVRRATDFRKASYDVVKEVGDVFGLDVKQRAMRFENKFQLLNWYRNVRHDMTKTHKGKHVEGYVLEAADGFMTKWKSPYYAFWKKMRSQHQRVGKMMENGQAPQDTAKGIRGIDWMTEDQRALAVEFNDWLWNGSGGTPSDIGPNIIEARKLFDRRFEPKPAPKEEAAPALAMR